jgi:hypothetical protein
LDANQHTEKAEPHCEPQPLDSKDFAPFAFGVNILEGMAI